MILSHASNNDSSLIGMTWPTTKRGCFFHHKQHDLVPEYNAENSAVRKAFQMMVAIAFVDFGNLVQMSVKHRVI